MAVGRITGPLLKENLLRDGVDLAFENDLLYLDVNNGRVGIGASLSAGTLTHDLTVVGTTRTTNLLVDTQADIATFTLIGNTIASSNSIISLEPSGANPVVYQAKLVLDDLQISANIIEVTAADTDLEFNTVGTGEVNINSHVTVNGDLHATGIITADGDITFGAGSQVQGSGDDTVSFVAEIASNVVPDVTNTYDLGTDPTTGGKAWRNAYVHNITTTNTTVVSLTVNQDLTVSGVTTLNGDVIFGDTSSDTIAFNSTIDSDLIPSTTAFYDLGTDSLRWNVGYFSRVEIDGLVIDSNTISTTANNDDLILIANGTGIISVPSNNVSFGQNLTVGQDLTVTTGTTYLKDVGITGDITQTGDIHLTGDFTTSGTAEITGNVTLTGALELSDITISGNTIEVTTLDTDLSLLPNGNGDIVFENIRVSNNTFQSTGTNQSITLQPNGTGSVIMDSNQSLIIPTGTDAQRPASPTNGMIRYNIDRSQYEGYNATYSKWLPLSGVADYDGNTKITAESAPGANENILSFYANSALVVTIDSTKLFAQQFETAGINIVDNTISAINTDADINLTTAGTGGVVIGNLKIQNNTITNISPNAVTEFSETGDGVVRIAGTNGVVIPHGDLTDLPTVTELGMVRFNTYYGFVEVFNGTTWVNVAGATSGISLAQAQDIGIVSALLFG